MAIKAVKERGICIRVACQAFRISESCYRYERKLDAQNEEVATWLIKLTDNNRNWGFGLCYLYLRNLKGFKWNHKRVYRVYKELELNLRKTSQTFNSRKARSFDSATGNQSSLVNGLYA